MDSSCSTGDTQPARAPRVGDVWTWRYLSARLPDRDYIVTDVSATHGVAFKVCRMPGRRRRLTPDDFWDRVDRGLLLLKKEGTHGS